MLGLSVKCALEAVRRADIDGKKISGPGSGIVGRGCWLWRREQVERLAEERQRVARLKVQGLRFCNGCEEWKDRHTEFSPSAHRCRECMRELNKAVWAKSKSHLRRSTFGNSSGERLSGSVQSYVGHLKPAAPADALQYACMDVGYHHRPLPVRNGRRMSKREAYCQICTAKRCMHHRELTPKELVRRWKMSRGRMAAGMS